MSPTFTPTSTTTSKAGHWQAAEEHLGESGLRAEWIRRARAGECYWMLPENLGTIFVYVINAAPKLPMLREHDGQEIEFVASGDDEADHNAIQALSESSLSSVCETRGFWTVYDIGSNAGEYSKFEEEIWGMYEPSARERVQAKQEQEVAVAVHCHHHPDEAGVFHAHSGFPSPMRGLRYRKNH